MASDKMWRNLVNSYEADLPSNGVGPPDIETISETKPAKRRGKFQVQKIVTEVYICTDAQNQSFASEVFQELHLLGEMSSAKLKKLIENEKRQRQQEQE